MKKIVLVFGLLSGAIVSLLMMLSVLFSDKIGFDHSEVLGYTIIVLSFLLVFFGVHSYRENVGGGRITFIRGFTVGILITLVSCVFYVVTWEVMYFFFLPGFMDKWTAHVVEKAQASGASAAAIQLQVAQMQKYKAMYDNPFLNAALTFIEPFPVGLGITLLAALVFRKKGSETAAEMAA